MFHVHLGLIDVFEKIINITSKNGFLKVIDDVYLKRAGPHSAVIARLTQETEVPGMFPLPLIQEGSDGICT